MLFVAEIGSNHKGNKSLAYEMVRQAKLAGADIAKFQLGHRKPDWKFDLTMPQWMRYMPNEWVEDIAHWCDVMDIEFMASIFSMDGLKAARSVNMRRYKFANPKALDAHCPSTREPSHNVVLKSMINEGKYVFASNRDYPPHKNIIPIFTVAEYPTYPLDIEIPEFGGKWYGYSSHVHGYADALVAIAKGAQYIEKHVTLSKSEESIKDNSFALSFEEFGEMVKIGREMEWLLG
jgi:sialic acid synthase SpsE